MTLYKMSAKILNSKLVVGIHKRIWILWIIRDINNKKEEKKFVNED